MNRFQQNHQLIYKIARLIGIFCLSFAIVVIILFMLHIVNDKLLEVFAGAALALGIFSFGMSFTYRKQ